MISNLSYDATNIGTLQKFEVQTFSFKNQWWQECNKEAERCFFIEVLLHYHFLNGMLHDPLFLYFPRASVLLFIFSQPISI